MPRSGQTQDIKLDASLLSAQHLEDRTRTGWPGVRVMWLDGVSVFRSFAAQYSSEAALCGNPITSEHRHDITEKTVENIVKYHRRETLAEDRNGSTRPTCQSSSDAEKHTFYFLNLSQ